MVFVYNYSRQPIFDNKVAADTWTFTGSLVCMYCTVNSNLFYQFIDVCTLNEVDTPQSLGECLHKPI